MKKITLLTAVLIAGMATAQVAQVAPEQMKLQKMEAKSIQMNKEISLKDWTGYSKKAASATYDLADYYVVEGMLYGGLDAEWGGYNLGMIMVPAYQNVVFENLYGPTTWTIGGETAEENTDTLEYGLLEPGLYKLPTTTDHMWQADDTTLLSVKGYLYGSTASNQYLIPGANHMVADEIIPMSQCAKYCDPLYSESGSDFYIVSAPSIGCPYSYGTDLVYQGKSFDTIISVVRNVSPLKINQINMPIYNAEATTISQVLPKGAQVKVELLAADLVNGIIYSDSVYASTIIDTLDCQIFGGGPGSLVAKFYEEDPFGGMAEVSVVCPGDFVVQITGYNEGNCNFGFLTDYYAPTSSTLFVINGKYKEFWNGGSNLAISYDAYWPVAVMAAESEVLVAPAEGGVAMDGEYEAVAILTNLLDPENEMYVEDAPEWIETVLDASQYAETGYVIAQFTAAANETATEREGVVTINADGYLLEVVIKQAAGEGTDNTALENVTLLNDNKLYNILGVEVDETYTGIVIKNGQKFIQ